ncbi:gluconate 2-dehydrogenase subunit 3 family protein [Aestuariivivens sediminis]|uniref:gluconate 2-dehydrogenase subunit 3 family protein n=1 Tax=Aestuariivivens sediminis TaxID=2913557 RepID=UPI001F568FD6|nr:gluconate 2-dehydrogenase subunit 3 family protein [Aestuariivivens sediminis]
MKRREALKNMGISTAFFLATPAVINLMQSCTSDTNSWIPEFLTEEEGVILSNLVDVILPKTEDLPSALELNVPQFIDKYMNEVFDDESQVHCKSGMAKILDLLKPDQEYPVNKLTPHDYRNLLDNYMLINGEKDQERESVPESLAPTTSEFLNSIKWMTINAYKTTEYISEHVLAYDPIPGAYYCGDLNELTGGKSWSL